MGMLYSESEHIVFGFIDENMTAMKYSKLSNWMQMKNESLLKMQQRKQNEQTSKKNPYIYRSNNDQSALLWRLLFILQILALIGSTDTEPGGWIAGM